MKNPTRHKIAHKVALAELRKEFHSTRNQQKIAGSKGLFRELKVRQAKMAVAKAGVKLMQAKMRYDANDPWVMVLWEPQVNYDMAVSQLNKLMSKYHER
jgi:hypothetical protein